MRTSSSAFRVPGFIVHWNGSGWLLQRCQSHIALPRVSEDAYEEPG
jgi:hypothetical protein